jgi:transposase
MDYVGIDLHKRESQLYVITTDGEPIEKRIKTERARFAEVLPKLAPAGARVLLEASTESAWAAPFLRELGYEVIVADPNFAPMYGTSSSKRRRIKTDRRDAQALAEAARSGTYRVAHEVSETTRERRNLLTARDQLVAMRSKSIVTARSLLRQFGLGVGPGLAETFAARIRALALPATVKRAISPLLAMVDVACAQILELDEQIRAIAESDPTTRRLMTVHGVGPVTAVAFAAAIEDARRFSNAHKVSAYLGLVPGENSSGDGHRRTSITKTGSSHVRWLLVQAALCIMRTGASRAPALHAWAKQLAARRGSKITRVALARRLSGVLFALMRDEKNFDPTKGLRMAAA